ncbi:MAG: hypothetical protein NT001_04945 [Candidatus Woesearchaeota archaeon]|nr:hypothetical protein [Candidatus Woesearchaeota archaeon]
MASKIKNFFKGASNCIPIYSSLKKDNKAVDVAMNNLGTIAAGSTNVSGADVWETMYKCGVNNSRTRNALKKKLKENKYTIDDCVIGDKNKYENGKSKDGWKKVKSKNVWKEFAGLEIYKGDDGWLSWDTFKRNTRISGEVRAAVSATALGVFGLSAYYALGSAAGGADEVTKGHYYSKGYGLGLGALGVISSIASGSIDGTLRSAALVSANTSAITKYPKLSYLLGLGLTASTLGFAYGAVNHSVPHANHAFSDLGREAKETGHNLIDSASTKYHSLEDSVKGVASDVYIHVRHPFSGHDAAGHDNGHNNPSGHGRTPGHGNNGPHGNAPVTAPNAPVAPSDIHQDAPAATENNNLSDYYNPHPHRVWANYGTTRVMSTDLVERSLGVQGDHFSVLNLDHAMKDINSGANLPHGVGQPYHGLHPQDLALRVTEKDGHVYLINLDANGRSADLPQFIHNGRLSEHVRWAELCYNDNHGTPSNINDDTLYVFATALGEHGHNAQGHGHSYGGYGHQISRGNAPHIINKHDNTSTININTDTNTTINHNDQGNYTYPSNWNQTGSAPEGINTTLRVESSPWESHHRNGTLDYAAIANTEGVRSDDVRGVAYTGQTVYVNPQGNHVHNSAVYDAQGNQEHLNGTWGNIFRPGDHHKYQVGEWKPGMPLQIGLTRGADHIEGNQGVIFHYGHEQGYNPHGQHTNAQSGNVAEAYADSPYQNGVHTSRDSHTINTQWDNGYETNRAIEVRGNEGRSEYIGIVKGAILGYGLRSALPTPSGSSNVYSGIHGGQVTGPPINGGQ